MIDISEVTVARRPGELNQDAIAETSACLRSLLADVFCLYLKTKNFHWHMTGIHFREFHLLLDEQAGQIFAMTDEIAERARKIGGVALHSIGEVSRYQRLSDNDCESVSPENMLVELRDDNASLARFLRAAHEISGKNRDVATTSLIETWIDQAEHRVWFLSEIVNPEINNASVATYTRAERETSMVSNLINKRTIAGLRLFLAVTLAPHTLFAQTSKSRVQNIVLVHGAWADGSSWSKIIPLLVERGFNVVAVQNPLTALQDDVTTTKQALARVQASNPGPVLLVGHSYGGTVITEAGTDPDVAGLVYVAAFAPDNNESTLGLASEYPPAPALDQLISDNFGFVTLSHDGIFEDFAQDVSPHEKELLFAAQAPTALADLAAVVTSPAWRVKPCWFVVAADDRAISPELERFEAKRMKAITIELPTSHVAMISEPNIVAEFIATAALNAGKQ